MLAEAVPQTHREGVVTVVSAVPEQEVSVDRAIQRVVGEAMHAALLDELQFQENGSRQFFLQANAPVQVSRCGERVPVHNERGRQWYRRGLRRRRRRSAGNSGAVCFLRAPIRIEKVINSLPFESLMDQPQAGCIVGNPNSRRQLGIAFVVENVSPRQAWREQRRPDDLIPIEAQARLNEQTIRNQPSILGIGAGLSIVERRVIAPRKHRIARASWLAARSEVHSHR